MANTHSLRGKIHQNLKNILCPTWKQTYFRSIKGLNDNTKVINTLEILQNSFKILSLEELYMLKSSEMNIKLVKIEDV